MDALSETKVMSGDALSREPRKFYVPEASPERRAFIRPFNFSVAPHAAGPFFTSPRSVRLGTDAAGGFD